MTITLLVGMLARMKSTYAILAILALLTACESRQPCYTTGCDDSSVCLDGPGGFFCALSCSDSSGCAASEACGPAAWDGSLVCAPACTDGEVLRGDRAALLCIDGRFASCAGAAGKGCSSLNCLCSEDEFCDHDLDECASSRALGDACEVDSQCQSGVCSYLDSTCVEPGSIGDDCSRPAECESDTCSVVTSNATSPNRGVCEAPGGTPCEPGDGTCRFCEDTSVGSRCARLCREDGQSVECPSRDG